VLLYDGKPVLGIVVEVQLSVDEHKRFAWPVYVVGLRARMRCPVCLLVVCNEDSVTRWSAKSIELGGPCQVRVPDRVRKALLFPGQASGASRTQGGRYLKAKTLDDVFKKR
jgi:hypothetical protein